MKRLIVLTVLAVTMAGTSTAQANDKKQDAIKTQLARYYHADGYIKSIGHVAFRTIYHPNKEKRVKWVRAVRWLISVRADARAKIDALRAPPLVFRSCDAYGRCVGASIEQVQSAIASVFGGSAWQAIAVSRCETGGKFNTNAANGQFKSIFQMGDHERATYGDARDAVGAARAAFSYFRAAGSDWSPWECKP